MGKKSIISITLFALVLTGCSNQKPIKTESEEVGEATKKNVEEKKYDIDKIVIPIQTEWQDDLKVYEEFSTAVIKEMAHSNGIPVEIRDVPTFDDALIAVRRGDADVIPGIDNLALGETELIKTYTYFTGALYFSNGDEFIPEKSYSMVVRAENKELLDFFNDAILEAKDTGIIERLEKQYLGERKGQEEKE